MRPSPAPFASNISRRAFLVDTGRAGAVGLLVLSLPWLASASACSNAHAGDAPTALTKGEARTLGAFAQQILPADGDFPGAEAAGASTFVSRALATPKYAPQLKQIQDGLADLDKRATAKGAASFADLSSDAQIAVMTDIEKSDFFSAARTLVLLGTFADPKYGGNKNGAGWALLKFDHSPSHPAPFGYYDQAATAHQVPAAGVAK